MDEDTLRSYAEAHGKAVVDGDIPHLMADMTPEAQAGMNDLGRALPRPTTQADVRSIEIDGDSAVVHIRYSGGEREVTIRSVWRQEGERPLIVEAAPV